MEHAMKLTLRLTDGHGNEIDSWVINATQENSKEAYKKVNQIDDELRLLVEDAMTKGIKDDDEE